MRNRSLIIRLPILLLLSLPRLAPAQETSWEKTRLQVESRQHILSNDERTYSPHNQLHFPFLYEAADGTWYMTYREGPHSAAPASDRVQTVMSSDGGKTWLSWPGLEAEPQLRFFLTKLSDGTLISHGYTLEHPKDAGDGKPATGYILRSRDDGRTWTRTSMAVNGLPWAGFTGMWGKIVEMPGDRLLCSIYGTNDRAPSVLRGKYSNGVIESLDGARSWKYLSPLSSNTELGKEGPNEADLERLSATELLCVFRSGGSSLHQARSLDGGKTRSSPRDLGVVRK